MQDMAINPELVVNDLLEQNKQQTLQISMLRAALNQRDAQIKMLLDERGAMQEKMQELNASGATASVRPPRKKTADG